MSCHKHFLTSLLHYPLSEMVEESTLLSLGHTEGHRFNSVCFYAESVGKTNRDKETTETSENHTELQEHAHGKLFMQLISIRH